MAQNKKPRAKSRDLEYKIQSEFMSIIRYYTEKYPLLELIHSTPNEGKRSHNQARKLRNSGMKSGVCDISFNFPNGQYGSLHLEFKTLTGVVSPNQKNYIELLRRARNRAEVVRSAEHALKLVEEHTGYNLPYFNITQGELPNGSI
jgi:hypothetical protein